MASDERPKWITIQMNTFVNWLNLQLQSTDVQVRDLSTDLSDGVVLIQVVETLQQRICTGKIYRHDPTEIQKLMNVQMALDALREDRVKLVNIGSQDIVEGNLKLILGLVWCLIQRYQIATHSKIPPKKLIMAWLQSVLTGFKLTNFRTNWNDGRALSALVDYCQPGLCPDWRNLSPRNRVANCARALSLAERHFNIPAIISAEHLSSDELDELSCLTYLSYFVKRNGPGYIATLERVSSLIPDVRIPDFDRSWNDGYLLARLIESAGGSVPSFDRMVFEDPSYWPTNVSQALEAALDLGVASLVSADDIVEVESEHLGIMALVAALMTTMDDSASASTPAQAAPAPAEHIETTCFQHQQLNLDLAFAEGSNVRIEDIDVVIRGPTGHVLDNRVLELRKNRTLKGAVVSFVPKAMGSYKVHIFCEKTELGTSPISLNVLAPPTPTPPTPPPPPPSLPPPLLSSSIQTTQQSSPVSTPRQYQTSAASPTPISTPRQYQTSAASPSLSPNALPPPPTEMDYYAPRASPSAAGIANVVSFSGLSEPCSIGSIVEVVINSQGDRPDDEAISVFAESPTRKRVPCDVSFQESSFTASFTPNEIGEWLIGILYDGDHIKGSPFSCQVFDASLVQVYGLDVGLVGQELKFIVDASNAGIGDVTVDIFRHGKAIPCEVEEERHGVRHLPTGKFSVSFTPSGAGQYKIHIAFNELEIKGSPFILDIADANSVSVYGDNLRMAAVDRLATFMVHAVGAESRDVSVIITGPSNKRKHARIVQIDESTFRIEWKPIEAGEHLIDVRLYDQSVYEAPFVCNVGDPELVSVKHIPQFVDTRNLNKDHTFEIDASAAGSGNLEIVINGGRVACRVRELCPRQFVAQFTPTQRVPHIIEMKFNGEHVRGSPWNLPTRESSTYATRDSSTGAELSQFSELVGVGLHRAAVGEPATFDISAIPATPDDDVPLEPLRASSVVVRVYDPEGRSVETRIREQPAGVRVEYTVQQVGDHRLEVYINDRLIDSGPLYVAGYDPHKIVIQPVGGSTVGQPVQFIVDAVEAGKGQLEISVNQGRVPNNVQMKGAGRCLVTFIPQHAGVYVIDVTFNGHQVHGCPIRVEVQSKQVGKPVSTTTGTDSGLAPKTSPAVASNAPPAGPAPATPIYGSATAFSPSSAASPVSNKEKTTFSAASPTYVDTSYASSPPGRRYAYESSPRSTSLARSPPAASPRDSELRSPRLLRQGVATSPPPVPSGLGYTIANYGSPTGVGSDAGEASSPPKRYFGDTVPETKDFAHLKATFERRDAPEPEPVSPTSPTERSGHFSATSPARKFFDELDSAAVAAARQGPPPARVDDDRVKRQSDHRVIRGPDGGLVRTTEEITTRQSVTSPGAYSVDYRAEAYSTSPPAARSGLPRVNLDRERPYAAESTRTYDHPPTFDRPGAGAGAYERPSPGAYERSPPPPVHRDVQSVHTNIYDEVSRDATLPLVHPPPLPKSQPPTEVLPRANELDGLPLEGNARRTADSMRAKEEDDRILDRYGLSSHPSMQSGSEQEQGIIEPYPSDLESLTAEQKYRIDPGTKQASHETEVVISEPHLQKGAFPQQVPPQEVEVEVEKPSQTSSKSTTPRISLRFGKDKPPKSPEGPPPGRPFDFGKSKLTSKHEVVRRGKDVEVKIENLKLGKEDTLRVVVTPPTRKPGQTAEFNEEPAPAPEVPFKLKKSGKNYEISFRPAEVGTHKVLVFVNDEPHPSVPFPIRVYDASQIMVGEIVKESVINDTVEFTVDAGRAGFGNLEMAIKDHDGVIIPSHVSQLESGSAKFLVTFNPTSLGTHTVNVTFNKEVIKGSPFEVKIVERIGEGVDLKTASNVEKKKSKKDKKESKRNGVKKSNASIGEAAVERIPSLSRVGKEAALTLSAPHGAGIEAVVTDSQKREIPVKVLNEEGDDEIHLIQFIPEGVGDHEITIRVNGKDVNGSPFVCRVHDPERIKVGEIPDGVVNQPVSFIVDAAEAGVGNLEVAVNEGTIASMARALGHHKYEISFVPVDSAEHKISIRFNNEPVPGSPFVAHVGAQTQVTAYGPGLERVPLGKPTQFTVHVADDRAQMPGVTVTDPSGQKLPVTVHKEDNGTDFVIEYTPHSVGNHSIEVTYGGVPVGQPFVSKGFDADRARLTLDEDAVVGKPCTFVIDAAKAGAGNMEIIVSVDGRNVPNYVQAESQAKFKVAFTPTEAKEHVISVKFNGIPVPGSPLICSVAPQVPTTSSAPATAAAAAAAVSSAQQVGSAAPAGPSTKAPSKSAEELRLVGDLATAQVGKPKGFSIDAPRRNVECNVVVTDPQQSPLPVRCYKQQDDSYWVEFTPEQVGTHQIEVTFGDVPIVGSPFKSEVVDPRKVVIKGVDDVFTARQIANFAIDRRAAGNGALEISLTDPQGEELKLEQIRNSVGDDSVTFLPIKLGAHTLTAKLAGFQVPGTPTTLTVEEQGKPTLYGSAIDFAVEKDMQASMIFDPKKLAGGIKIDVRAPGGEKIRHSTNRRPDGTSEISFRPPQVGLYQVSVDFNNKPIAGSPYQVSVIDPKKVLVNDENIGQDGVLQLQYGQANQIDVDTTAAGPGQLRAEVRDANGEVVDDVAAVENLGYGRQRITLTPASPTTYKLYLYYANQVVPNAYPIVADASGGQGRIVQGHVKKQAAPAAPSPIDKVLLRGDGTRRATIQVPSEFVIDASEYPGAKVDATLQGEKVDIPVRLQHLGNNVHKASYTPLQAGTYNLHVTVDNRPVTSSPLAIEVRNSATSPAELVEVDQKSLKIGIIGEDVKTLIDTRKAGSGFLSAQCVGPTKLAYCELYDHRDGTYLLSLKPSELGKHTLIIKYSEEHVPGSPFAFNVSNPPDPSRVKVQGPGVQHGILHTFKSNFVVETKGAGAGQLTVRVRGPKGAFNVEMQRDKVNDRTIHCKYEPKEPGDYQVEVKWHGQHVPGSPFFVMIVDTEEELARFLAGEPPSNPPSVPFLPPGWNGPPLGVPYPPQGPPPGVLYARPPGPPMGPSSRRIYGPGLHGPPPRGPPFMPPPAALHQLPPSQRRRHY